MKSLLRRMVPIVHLVALTCVACVSDKPELGQWHGSLDTLPGGAVRASNPNRGMWDSGGAWRVDEQLRIGSGGGEGPESFADIRAIEVDKAGRIYVLDAGAQEVRVFDSLGGFIRTIGRKGSGPGELKDGIGLAWDIHGLLWVVDQANARLTAFDTAGGYVTEKRRMFSNHMTWSWEGRILDDGRLIEWIPGATLDEPARLVELDSTFLLPRDTFALPLFNGVYFEVKESSRHIRVGVPFSASLIWLLDPRGTLWFGTSGEYRVYRRSLEGDTLLIIEKESTPIPVTREEKDSALGTYEWFTRQGGTLDPGSIPPVKPAYRRFFPDGRGNLWVAPYVSDSRGRVFDVFDPQGKYLGQLTTSFEINQPPVFRGPNMFVITEDSLGVPVVIRARVD